MIAGRGIPDGSVPEGGRGSIAGRGTPDGSGAEGRRGLIGDDDPIRSLDDEQEVGISAVDRPASPFGSAAVRGSPAVDHGVPSAVVIGTPIALLSRGDSAPLLAGVSWPEIEIALVADGVHLLLQISATAPIDPDSARMDRVRLRLTRDDLQDAIDWMDGRSVTDCRGEVHVGYLSAAAGRSPVEESSPAESVGDASRSPAEEPRMAAEPKSDAGRSPAGGSTPLDDLLLRERDARLLAEAEVLRLTIRRDELLELVRRISQSTPLADELTGWESQRARMIAEIGTLRAANADLTRGALGLLDDLIVYMSEFGDSPRLLYEHLVRIARSAAPGPRAHDAVLAMERLLWAWGLSESMLDLEVSPTGK
jgi:hypothetical protein